MGGDGCVRVGLAAVKVQNMGLKHHQDASTSDTQTHGCKVAQDARELLQSVAHFSRKTPVTAPLFSPSARFPGFFRTAGRGKMVRWT